MLDNKNQLFNEFESVSSKEWKQKIQFELKGADYNDTLVWESLEGIKVKPFYHQDELENILSTKTNVSNFKILQDIFVFDVEKSNNKAKEVLGRYQNTLKPMHQQFIEPTKAYADIIIPNDKYNTVAIDVVRAVINQRLV